jgi:hypothetical protein
MPFKNEFASRQEDPEKYKSFHRENNKFDAGIDAIWGTLPSGKTEIQTIRFRTSKFKTKEQVHAWLENHKFKTSIECPENDSIDKLTNDCYQFDSIGKIKVSKQVDGSYKGIAFVTKTGIFNYKNANGKQIKQLRHPNDVFSKDSLNTLKMLPITKHHVDKLVTPENMKEYLIGYTGENIEIDGEKIAISICINTDKGIHAIESDGLLELSCAYELDKEEIPGVYDSMNYDCKQKNIKYNHLALCSKARLGSDLRINLDSNDCILINDNINYQNNLFNFKEGDCNMSKFKIDGIDYDAAPEIIVALEKSIKSNTDSVTQIAELKNQLSTVTANYDSYKSKLEKTEQGLPMIIDAAVNERVNLFSLVKIQLDSKEIEGIEKLSNIDIKKKVIGKYLSGINLDNKDSMYINACYDTISVLNKKDDNTAANNQAKGSSQGDSKGDIVEDSRKKYLLRLKEGYKQK